MLTNQPSDPAAQATLVATTYTYDPAGHLTSIDTGSEATLVHFGIDALGRHAGQSIGPVGAETAVTTYAYLGTSDTVSSSRKVEDRDPDPDEVTLTYSAIDAIGNRLTTGTAEGFAYLLPDLHGNVVATMTSGSTPAFSAAYRYDAYGVTCDSYAPSGSIASPWRYQGRILESADGTADLYDFSARSYDPGLGAFTSFDSVSGSAQNPLTLNRYLYANANPATMIDPDGHCSVFDYNSWGGCLTDASSRLNEGIGKGASLVVTTMFLDPVVTGLDFLGPGFNDAIVSHLPDPVQRVWGAVSSPPAVLLNTYRGFVDGIGDVVESVVDTPSNALGCAFNGDCRNSVLSSITDPGKMLRGGLSQGKTVVDNLVDKASRGDWAGVGKDVGHAAVAVDVAAGVVSGLSGLVSSLKKINWGGVASGIRATASYVKANGWGTPADWFRIKPTDVSNQLLIGPGTPGSQTRWAISLGGGTGTYKLPFWGHIGFYNLLKPDLWFKYTPILPASRRTTIRI